MDTVASSALEARASSIAVRSARCDSGKSFKATTILVNIKATRAEPTRSLSYESGSGDRHYMFLLGIAPRRSMGKGAGRGMAISPRSNLGVHNARTSDRLKRPRREEYYIF